MNFKFFPAISGKIQQIGENFAFDLKKKICDFK